MCGSGVCNFMKLGLNLDSISHCILLLEVKKSFKSGSVFCGSFGVFLKMLPYMIVEMCM